MAYNPYRPENYRQAPASIMEVDEIEPAIRYPDQYQEWQPTPSQPYPMTFTDGIYPRQQVLVSYNGRPMYQALNNIGEPIMIPVNDNPFPRPSERHRWGTKIGYVWERGAPYPMTHSIPTQFQLGFINAMGRGRRF